MPVRTSQLAFSPDSVLQFSLRAAPLSSAKRRGHAAHTVTRANTVRPQWQHRETPKPSPPVWASAPAGIQTHMTHDERAGHGAVRHCQCTVHTRTARRGTPHGTGTAASLRRASHGAAAGPAAFRVRVGVGVEVNQAGALGAGTGSRQAARARRGRPTCRQRANLNLNLKAET